MKKLLQNAAAITLFALPGLLKSQADLTIGLNFSYDPPANCDNKIKNLAVDICNNGSSAAGSFIVGIYLYNPGTSEKWVIDQTTMSSLSGNACRTIDHWDIDMNNYCCLPAPGTNYRIGVWADTANTVTDSDRSNNAALLDGNIQVCAKSTATGLSFLKKNATSVNVSPNPAVNNSNVSLTLAGEENVAVSVCDVSGKEIYNNAFGKMSAGAHDIALPTAGFETGIYFVKVNVSGAAITKKLVIAK